MTENVDEAPRPDSAEFLTDSNPVEKASPGTTADTPATEPGHISADPAQVDDDNSSEDS